MYSAKQPGRLTPTPWVFRHRCRRPARQLRQWPQVMWPSPETRSPTASPRTSLPIATISPQYSWPICIGTGIVRCAQASHCQMWMSVPQIAVLRMRISTSLGPGSGFGQLAEPDAGLPSRLDQCLHAMLASLADDAEFPSRLRECRGRRLEHRARVRRRTSACGCAPCPSARPGTRSRSRRRRARAGGPPCARRARRRRS